MAFTSRGSAAATAATPTSVTIPTVAGGGVLWVVIGSRGGVGITVTSVTSPAATFTLARAQLRPENDRGVSVFWSNDYEAQSNMPITITHSATPSAVIWAAAEQTDVTLTGSPVAQSNSVAHTSSATPSTTLSAGTGEMLVAACWSGTGTATPEAGGTELFDLLSGTTGMAGYWKATVDTTPSMTLSTAASTGFVALETVTAVTAEPGKADIAQVTAAVPDAVPVPRQVSGVTHRHEGYDNVDAPRFFVTVPTVRGGGALWLTLLTTGTPVTPAPTVTVTGGTFTLVGSQLFHSDQKRLSVYWSRDYDGPTTNLLIKVAHPSAGTFGSVAWSVEEQYGDPGATPVTQSQTATTSGTTIGTTLTAGPGWMLVAAASSTSVTDFTPGSGAELSGQYHNAPDAALTVYWDRAVDTTPGVAADLTGTMALIAVETPGVPFSAAEVGYVLGVVPDPSTGPGAARGDIAWASLEVPDVPTIPSVWDPSDCETLEYRNPHGEVVRFLTLIGTVGRFMPPILVSTIPTPASHGSHYLGAAHTERPVAVPVAIPGPIDGRAALRTWARILDPSVGEGTLSVVNGEWAGRRLRCVYEAGLDEWAEMNRRVNQGTLLFRAAWPYWEDSSESSSEVDQDNTQRFWFPFLPLVLGASDAWAALNMENSGDVDAWPVITVRGPTEEVTLTNVTTGAFWQVTGTVAAGSTLVVDHRPGHKTVQVDGVNAFDRLTETSSLWPLQRGVNQIEVGAAVTTTETLVSFTWRRLWLAA